VTITGAPTFRVRAAGSFEPLPGCPDSAVEALTPEGVEALCLGECHHPSDQRRPITRIEVVRIRPQQSEGEDIRPLIEDPWRRFDCPAAGEGCEVVFSDPAFGLDPRPTSYYVRAIEVATPTVNADPLSCEADDDGRCLAIDPCFDRQDDDDCLAPSEHRAWSSPIFVDPA
jgi:hypothetical protein